MSDPAIENAVDRFFPDDTEAEAPEEGTPEVTEEPQAQEGPARDPETGQFITAEEAEERLYAGKYKSPEELEQAHYELYQLLARQSEELGQSRKQEPQPGPDYDDDDFESIVETRPDMAAQIAVQQQNPYRYEQAIAAWAEINPLQATRFDGQIREAALYSKIVNEIAPVVKPMYQSHDEQITSNAINSLRSEYPDFDTYQPQMMQAANLLGDRVVSAITEGTPEERYGLFRGLYMMAKGMGTAPPPQATPAGAPTPVPQDPAAAKLAAAVASGSISTPQSTRDTIEQGVWAIFDKEAGLNSD